VIKFQGKPSFSAGNAAGDHYREKSPEWWNIFSVMRREKWSPRRPGFLGPIIF
jgi:hypothetical protein